MTAQTRVGRVLRNGPGTTRKQQDGQADQPQDDNDLAVVVPG